MAMLIISYLTWCESLLILPSSQIEGLEVKSDGQDPQIMLNPSKLHHFFKPCEKYTALYETKSLLGTRIVLLCSHLATPARKKITQSLKIPTVWHFDQ